MTERLLNKLEGHIANTGRYPPIIVRPIPGCRDDSYQVLDGHHRLEVLKRLNHTHADCLVWEADEEEALILLATLNRLQGEDDPRKRASLINHLSKRHDPTQLTKLLPERVEQVKRLMELGLPKPIPHAPEPIDNMPVAVHFFLLPAQKRKLLDRLKAIGGTREEALMGLMEAIDSIDLNTHSD